MLKAPCCQGISHPRWGKYLRGDHGIFVFCFVMVMGLKTLGARGASNLLEEPPFPVRVVRPLALKFFDELRKT